MLLLQTEETNLCIIRAERYKVEGVNTVLEERVNMMRAECAAAQDDFAHMELQSQLGSLEKEVEVLTKQTHELENAVAGGVEGMQAEIGSMQKEVAEVTDNIHVLEGRLQKAGIDKDSMEMFRRECYGIMYVEGEGLPEIEGL